LVGDRQAAARAIIDGGAWWAGVIVTVRAKSDVGVNKNMQKAVPSIYIEARPL